MISEYKNNCLIGYSGLIGQTLMSNCDFKYLINSSNIDSIIDSELDLVICAAPSATKWKINIDDKDDLKSIDNITSVLSKIRCKKIILCSTIDVYGNKIGLGYNEDIFPMTLENHNYGKNRILLENNLKKIFSKKLTIIRLSGLFGNFLKKNLLFDIKTNNKNMLENINFESSFQWYNLNNLSDDIKNNLDKDIIHLVNEPVFNYEIFKKLNLNISHNPSSLKINYDIRTKYLKNNYIHDKDHVINEIINYLTI